MTAQRPTQVVVSPPAEKSPPPAESPISEPAVVVTPSEPAVESPKPTEVDLGVQTRQGKCNDYSCRNERRLTLTQASGKLNLRQNPNERRRKLASSPNLKKRSLVFMTPFLFSLVSYYGLCSSGHSQTTRKTSSKRRPTRFTPFPKPNRPRSFPNFTTQKWEHFP